jgi:tetratricopeptide (TPR) repeat protein
MAKRKKTKGRTRSAEKRAPRTSRKRTPLSPRVLLVLAVIILAGMGLRGLYLHELVNTPDFEFPLVDADYHDYWARGMASGIWAPPRFEPDPKIQQYPYFRPPGYPFFLAAIYKLSGRGYVAPRVVQMAVGLLNALLAFALARRLFGHIVGLIVAALMSVYWVFIYFEGEFLEPSFAVLLALLVVYVLVTWLKDMSRLRMLAAGILVGALALVRPNALLWVPTVALWMLWVMNRRGVKRRAVMGAAALIIGTLIAVVPVTIRNSVVGHDFVPISSNGGVNLFIGNNERADGLVRGTMPGIGTLDTSFDHLAIVAGVERKTGRSMKHSEVSDYLAHEAFGWMRKHPGRVVGLMWKKTLLFWGPAEPADNKVVAGDRAHSAILSRIPLTFSMALALALAGLLLLVHDCRPRARTSGKAADHAQERWEIVVLILYLVLVWYASHLPFAITARYRVPIIPFLLLLGAFYIERMWRIVRDKDWKRTAIWVSVLVAALILANIDVASDDEPSMARWHYQRGIAFTRSGRPDRAIGEYRSALQMNPEYAAVHNDLAAMLAGTGRIAESIPHFRKALAGKPNDGSLHFNLGLALELVGGMEEARSHYARALRLRPGDGEARAGLSRVEQALAESGVGGR